MAVMQAADMVEVPILAESDYRRNVGIRLRQLIDALEMPYVKAAEEMGVQKSHLGNWMRERPKGGYPSPYAVYKFCRRHGVTFDWVFLGDPSGLPHRVAEKLLSAPVSKPEVKTGRGSRGSVRQRESAKTS